MMLACGFFWRSASRFASSEVKSITGTFQFMPVQEAPVASDWPGP
jgi:hypothetical protein